jgi:hypothetical protein
MFRVSTTHHQEVRCTSTYLANGTSKMTVGEPGWKGIPPRLPDSHLRSTFCNIHTYTLPPDDGLLMPETRRGILIQKIKNKQCIELVITYIIHNARSTQHKTQVFDRKEGTNSTCSQTNKVTALCVLHSTRTPSLIQTQCKVKLISNKYKTKLGSSWNTYRILSVPTIP